jgi:hypothetical protein
MKIKFIHKTIENTKDNRANSLRRMRLMALARRNPLIFIRELSHGS